MTNNIISELLELNSDKRKILLNSLRNRGISSRTLDAMNKIPREYFLNPNLFDVAYEDRALPIGNQQTISQPLTVGLMTDLLDLNKGDKVLEIGTGSGYQALILNQLGAEVYTIERIPELYTKAISTFKEFGVAINCSLGDGTLGLLGLTEFAGIIVTAGAPFIPEELKSQLSIGGIMVIPVGDKRGQVMTKVVRTSETDFLITEHDNYRFVPLIGKAGWDE